MVEDSKMKRQKDEKSLVKKDDCPRRWRLLLPMIQLTYSTTFGNQPLVFEHGLKEDVLYLKIERMQLGVRPKHKTRHHRDSNQQK
jgi:hypothetical protein